MNNYYGRITLATSAGDDFFDTVPAPSFALACTELGFAIRMFPSCSVLKYEVINKTDNTSITVWEMDEHSKECSCRFAKTNKNFHKMWSILEERWNSLQLAQSKYDDYLYGGNEFPNFS